MGFLDQNKKRVHVQLCQPWQKWKVAKDTKEKTYPCPSCGELMRSYQLGLHVNSCPGPWAEDDWEVWRKQAYMGRDGVQLRDDPDMEEGEDYVVCKLCEGRFRRLSVHLKKKHGLTTWKYRYLLGGETEAPKSRDRRLGTMEERYGVQHPLQDPDINAAAQEKRQATCLERFGSHSPFSGGCIEPPKKNRLEEAVDLMSPDNVVYVGDHSYWIRCQGADGVWKNRNPDFVVYDEEKLAEVSGGKSVNEVRTWRVVEVFGDYFHGKAATGMGKEEYEAARKAEYATVGVTCLVVWESEVKKDTEGVRERVLEFVSG